MAYRDIYSQWQSDPEGFWMGASRAIDWTRSPSRAFFDQGPVGEWFADGMVNTCWNAIDRHVAAGHGDRIAVIHDSAMTGQVARMTYAELQDRVARLAGVLAAHGVGMGDRVIIYMPMIPEALQAMLACARIGAIHSVVFGGFAAHELAVRIDDAQPKAILAASCGLEPNRTVPYKPLLDKVGLTYTQYIAMVALSDKDELTVSALGEKLFLESNTLTPILKKLEQMGYIKRHRDPADERQVRVSLTPAGKKLIEQDLSVSLIEATELGDEFPVVQKTVSRLRDNLLRNTQAGREKKRGSPAPSR